MLSHADIPISEPSKVHRDIVEVHDLLSALFDRLLKAHATVYLLYRCQCTWYQIVVRILIGSHLLPVLWLKDLSLPKVSQLCFGCMPLSFGFMCESNAVMHCLAPAVPSHVKVCSTILKWSRITNLSKGTHCWPIDVFTLGQVHVIGTERHLCLGA